MSLSIIAERIADYAKSEAKRASHVQVEGPHLLAAIRRLQEEIFDQRYPGLGERVREYLRANPGESIKSPELAADMLSHLSEIRTDADVWTVADALVGECDSQLSQRPEMSLGTMKVGSEKSPVSESEPLDDPLPFPITESLINRIAEISQMDTQTTANLLLTASLLVANEVLGESPESLFEELCSAAHLVAEPVSGNEAGLIVSTLVALPHELAGRIATQVALALVEVAEWAAARDENVTSEETDRIDQIRMRFRGQLADKLNVESDAMAAFERKFAHLVGMESVKTEIRKRVDYLVVNKRREKRGMSHSSQRMHMAFVGNPGTGKTSVARLYGELLHDLGLLPANKFVETDRSGLVGQYVGHTDQKTAEVIESADGGVLFIDEVYALNDGYSQQKGFGEEATNVIVKQMEDRRDRLVVILAGYKKETLQFMNVNPGLLSRVPVVVDFPDYSDDELLEIAIQIAERQGLSIDNDAKPRLLEILVHARAHDGFGNARTVENVLESAQRNAVNRTAALGNLATERELRTILLSDLPEILPEKRKTIGFAPPSN